MNCPKCNAPIKPGAKFCTSCGQRIMPVEGNSPAQGTSGAGASVNESPKGNRVSPDFNEVKGRIYWNIQPGQVARIIDESEFDSYGRISGIIVQEGTTAFIRANGKTIASISGGVYDFTGSGNSIIAGLKKFCSFIVNLFRKKQEEAKEPSGEELYRQQQEAILEYARKGAAFSVVVLLDKAFPMLIGARQSNPDDYRNFVPMTIRTAHLDIKVGVNAYFRITEQEKFILHYLSGQKMLNTTHLLDSISDPVRTAVQDVLSDVDLASETVPKELCTKIKDAVNAVAPELFFGLSMVRIVEISASNEDLERFRALGREMYLSEQELDYLKRTNDFKNRLASVLAGQQVNEAASELDLRKRLAEVNKDGLLHESEVERFVHFLRNEQAVSLARSDDERDAALAELAKTGLLRQDEIDEIGHRVTTDRYRRGMAFQMMQLKDGIEFERIRMEGEAEKAALIVKKELELAGLQDDYQDSRFYKDLEKKKAVASAGLDIEQRKRDMDYQDARRIHDMKKEDDNAQFQQFIAMQRMSEEAKENERRHEAEMEQARLRNAEEMERMKWENAKDLSDEKVWALKGGDAAAEYARNKYSADAQREASDRLEAQRREMDGRLDAERASRDAEHRETQAQMFQMMREVLNMAGGMQNQKLEDKDRQLRERDERLLRQEGRMDTAYDRALDYTTKDSRPAAERQAPVRVTVESPAARTSVTCPECGAGLEPGAKFCPDCGTEIN